MTGSASWRNEEDDPHSRVIIFDTLGHMTDSAIIADDHFLGFTKVTFDDKILIFKSNFAANDHDPTLYKLTQNLEQDTFYTAPFTYDSLCSYQIEWDTIVLDDCGVIVGVEEHGGMEAGRQGSGEAWGHGGLEIWPNPAKEEIHVRWSMDDGRFYMDLEFWIYDVFGRITLSPPLGEARAGDRNWTLDVSSLPSGIYLLVANNGGAIIGSTKFIVSKP